ncbi:MAG TPA: PAS domain-containing protein [Candidatus Limnocylindrales bacterium]|nr:PAS domain-containing protein [Candidatus Limnocylindrales bacterium]
MQIPVRDRLVLAGLGAILLLHLGVLGTSHAATESPTASVILQAISMFLAALFAALAAARSRDFTRNFWILVSAGFVMMLVGLLRWQFAAVEEFELFSLLYLFHMVPFGLALLLNDRPRMDRTLNWPMILDYLQILLMVAILYTGFIYLPSRGATEDQLGALKRYFAFLLVSRNVVVTGGYWARALLAGSRRELLAFRTMAIYLSVYTAVSAVGQYVFLSVHPWPVWLDLNGSVPMLVAAWLFSQWQDLPSEQQRRLPGFRAVLALHLIPAILPVVVAALATSLAKTEPRLAWLAVGLSLAIFAARLLATTYSEQRAQRAVATSEALLRQFIKNTPAAVAMFDPEMRYLQHSERWLTDYHLDGQQIIGRSLYAVLPDLPEHWKEACRGALAGAVVRCEEDQFSRADGSAEWLQWEARPWHQADGKTGGVIMFTQVITERKKAEDRLRDFSGRILHMQDEERRRVARELHDTTGQSLAGLAMNLSALSKSAQEWAPKEREILEGCRETANGIWSELRTMSYLLHPPLLDEIGLVAALEWLAQGFSQRSGIRVAVDLPRKLARLPHEVELALFRVAQEALTNVHRHSGSTTATLRLKWTTGKSITLEIEDEGLGVPSTLDGAVGLVEQFGVGIAGMCERVRQLGGELLIRSKQHGGTLVQAVVPLEKEVTGEVASPHR